MPLLGCSSFLMVLLSSIAPIPGVAHVGQEYKRCLFVARFPAQPRNQKAGCRRPTSIRRKQIATIRIPPKSKTMSPMLNSPSRAWSANSGNRVCKVPPCHIGLAGCTEDGIPITGIDPALVFVTRAFIPSPQSISKTPVRTAGDRTARNTSHRIAQEAHSQIAGCSIHAK
jgi:hypothetical protein